MRYSSKKWGVWGWILPVMVMVFLVVRGGELQTEELSEKRGYEEELYASLVGETSVPNVKVAMERARGALRAIEYSEEFEELLKKRDFEMVEFIGRVLLFSKIFNSGVDFGQFIDESVTGIRGERGNLEDLDIRVLSAEEYRKKIHALRPNQKVLGDAFYLRGESKMYIRAESITSLVKFMVLILHEAVHAYLPEGIERNSQLSEAVTIMVLARALKLDEKNAALRLVADQSLRDLMVRLQQETLGDKG